MSTPYVTPLQMINAPLGIAWSSIPDLGATAAEQLAEQTNIANRASAMVDAYCNQPLRATVDTETVYGPDSRMTMEPNGAIHMLLSRWPVVAINSVSWALASTFPRVYTTLAAGLYDFDQAIMPVGGSTAAGADAVGGQGLMIAPGYINWSAGRRGFIVKTTYTNGWPHCGMTANAAAGAVSLTVDDTTGFTGAIATIYDGGQTETVTVSATSSTSGPGTLTVGATAYAHSAGVLVTCLPAVVQQATLLYCANIALVRGATALSVQSLPGSEEHIGAPDYAVEAEVLLHPFQRVI